MGHTSLMAMHATFYGGPADGGELVLLEPIRRRLRFPMTTLELVERFNAAPKGNLLVPNVPAVYQLDEVAEGKPWRDARGRVRYLYIVPAPTPTEGETDG